MKETQKTLEAFEYFVSLGGGATVANCTAIAEQFQVSDRTFWNWYSKLDWKKRLQARLQPEANQSLSETRGKFLADIQGNIELVNSAISSSMTRSADGSIDIPNGGNFAAIVGSYAILLQLALLVEGEVVKVGGSVSPVPQSGALAA